MISRNVGQIMDVCGGRLYNCDVKKNVGIFVNNDKDVEENCVYAAIKGSRFNGNEFAESACKKGAALIITEKKPDEELPCLVVEDISRALIELAHFYRKKEINKVALVTGSVGKTTVKELLASILSAGSPILKTRGNHNNTLGLPLTVLSNSGSDTAVLEAGISEIGEMEQLSYACCADVAIITNIGSMHAQSFKTMEVTAKEKLKCLKYAKSNCCLIIPYGDELLSGVKNAVTVSLDNDNADYWAENIVSDDEGSSFDLVQKDGKRIDGLYVPICGEHGVVDALLACAAAFLMGSNEELIRKGLYQYKNDELRQNIFEKNNVTVMLDCYNSGPQSLLASVNAFSLLCSSRQIKNTVLVLGSMLELGDISVEEHINIGKYIAKKSFSKVITFGDEAQSLALGALMGGFDGELLCFSDSQGDELQALLSTTDFSEYAVLIKGSRKLKMEELVPFVIKEK